MLWFCKWYTCYILLCYIIIVSCSLTYIILNSRGRRSSGNELQRYNSLFLPLARWMRCKFLRTGSLWICVINEYSKMGGWIEILNVEIACADRYNISASRGHRLYKISSWPSSGPMLSLLGKFSFLVPSKSACESNPIFHQNQHVIFSSLSFARLKRHNLRC